MSLRDYLVCDDPECGCHVAFQAQTGITQTLAGPESVLEVPPSTACKHGRLSCEVCGTSDRRDAVHTTQGGAGKVACLRRETKP